VQRAGHLSTDPWAAVRLSTVTTDPIALIPIDASNWRTAARLRPAPEQERFLAPNWYSLLEATYDPLMRPLLAVADEEPVGFVMYGFEPEEDQPWVYRLMVAPAHQGRGVGREIMRQTIERIRQEHPGHAIGVSYEPDNERAARLYESLGFEHHGRFIEGEKVVRLPAATDGTPDTTRSSFEGFLTRYLRAWRESSFEDLQATIAPDYAAREHADGELSDFGRAESLEGWKGGFGFARQHGATWQLELLQRVPMRPGEELVTIRAALKQDGKLLGPANLFMQVFRRSEDGAWALVRSYIETGVEVRALP